MVQDTKVHPISAHVCVEMTQENKKTTKSCNTGSANFLAQPSVYAVLSAIWWDAVVLSAAWTACLVTPVSITITQRLIWDDLQIVAYLCDVVLLLHVLSTKRVDWHDSTPHHHPSTARYTQAMNTGISLMDQIVGAGTPSAGTPSAGTPSAGTPSAGTPSLKPLLMACLEQRRLAALVTTVVHPFPQTKYP